MFSFICSPKSPPNSPNTELSTEDELKGVYINYNCNKVSFVINSLLRTLCAIWHSYRKPRAHLSAHCMHNYVYSSSLCRVIVVAVISVLEVYRELNAIEFFVRKLVPYWHCFALVLFFYLLTRTFRITREQ